MKVGSYGFLLSSTALRQTKGTLQPSTRRLERQRPFPFLARVATPGGLMLGATPPS